MKIIKFLPALFLVFQVLFNVSGQRISVHAQPVEAEQPVYYPPSPFQPPEPTQLTGKGGVAAAAVQTAVLGSGDDYIHGLIYANDYLWGSTRTSPARVLKIDPGTLSVVGRSILPTGQDDAEDIEFAQGYVWVVLYTNPARLVRVDPDTMTATTAIIFSAPKEMSDGASLAYAFGYLWAGGLNHLAKIDISNPLAPNYQLIDFSALALTDDVLFGSLQSSGASLWGVLLQYTEPDPYPYASTIIKMDPADPSANYRTADLAVLFPDDMVYTNGHLYLSSEEASESNAFKVTSTVTVTDTANASNTPSYGTFTNPLDPQSFWGVYANTPGKLIKFSFDLQQDLTLNLPDGFDYSNEIAFDDLGNMYVTTWQTPAGIVKYSASAAVSDLTITKSGSDAVLEWMHTDTDVTHYVVWRSTQPYFSPGDPGSLPIAKVNRVGLSASYTDVGAIGNTDTNYFYVVTAGNIYGLVSPVSNRVGEFDYSLTPGGSGNNGINVIATPLDVTSWLPDADALAAEIGASVQQVLHWNPVAQAFEFWFPAISFGTNFALQAGQVYWIQVDGSAPSLVSLPGLVPGQGTIQFNLLGNSSVCKNNDLTMPLDQSAITSADQLSADIGSVEQVLQWNEGAQAYEFWFPEIGFGTNFSTRIGYPYHVCLKASTLWP
jgi:hypothetical protein